MNIGADHWIEGVKRALVTGGAPMRTRRCLVFHFTAGVSALSSIEYWRKSGKASAHIVIERDGTIYQCRAFDITAGHAGVSRWRDPRDGKLYTGLNACSIGIELANAGDNAELARKHHFPVARATHRNGGKARWWEVYPDVQIAAATLLAQALVARYTLDDVTGHDCIAPERKADPGPLFPMQAMREACGLRGVPAVEWE